MVLNEKEIKKIIEDYYKKTYNKKINFDFYRLGYSIAVPCITENKKLNTNIIKHTSFQDMEKLSDEYISKIVAEKFPNTHYVKLNELEKIFIKLGYNKPKFLCSIYNDTLTYTAHISSTKNNSKNDELSK